MNIDKIYQSDIQMIHLNTNMGIEGVRDKYKSSIFGTLSFFISRSPESIYEKSDILSTISPIIEKGGDILGFSEVFGKKQLELVIDKLESKGYKTYYTNAFEMWSQDENGEHLYNVIGVKNSNFNGNVSIKRISQLRNNRKLEGKLISLLYFLRGAQELNLDKITSTKKYYSRLANGILDGAITSLDLGNGIDFSHLHVHADNPVLASYFIDHLETQKPHVMIGDFNIGNIYEFLSKPPFSGKDYRCLLSSDIRTFPFSKGFNSLGNIFHSSPDNIIANNKVESVFTGVINSASDHQGLISRIRVK